MEEDSNFHLSPSFSVAGGGRGVHIDVQINPKQCLVP